MNYLVANATTGEIICSGMADDPEQALIQCFDPTCSVIAHDFLNIIDETLYEISGGDLVLKSGATGPDPSGVTMITIQEATE